MANYVLRGCVVALIAAAVFGVSNTVLYVAGMSYVGLAMALGLRR